MDKALIGSNPEQDTKMEITLFQWKIYSAGEAFPLLATGWTFIVHDLFARSPIPFRTPQASVETLHVNPVCLSLAKTTG